MATMLVEQMVTSLSEIDTADQYHEALKKPDRFEDKRQEDS